MSDSHLDALAARQAEMERLYESMIGSLEGDNAKLHAELEDLQKEVAILKLEKDKQDKACGTTSHMTDSGVSTDCAELVNRSVNTSIAQSTKATATSPTKMAAKSTETDEDGELIALQRQVNQLEGVVTQGTMDCDALQQQKSGLLENHKQLSGKLGNVESQLHMTQHKLTTLQAVHELVLNKNESLSKDLQNVGDRLNAEMMEKDRLQRQLSAELEKACGESTRLSTEVSSVRQQLSSLQSECAAYRQREVDMNSELTKLTMERSNLQGKVNSLNSELVNQKAQHVSQSMKVQQLEAAKSHLESQVAEFKQDSIELFKKLEEVRQEKDDMSQQLGSLHSQLSESMKDWKNTIAEQTSQHDQVFNLHVYVKSLF